MILHTCCKISDPCDTLAGLHPKVDKRRGIRLISRLYAGEEKSVQMPREKKIFNDTSVKVRIVVSIVAHSLSVKKGRIMRTKV